jgi:HEAT repeat protein
LSDVLEKVQDWLGLCERNPSPFLEYESWTWTVVDPAAVRVLAELVPDDDLDLAVYACRILCHIGKEAQAAVPVLLKQLDDGERQRRFWAALALAKVQPDHSRPVDLLLEMLQDQLLSGSSDLESLVLALGSIGPAARSAYHLLFELLHCEPPSYSLASLLDDPDRPFDELPVRQVWLTPEGRILSWALHRIDSKRADDDGIEYPGLEVVGWP